MMTREGARGMGGTDGVKVILPSITSYCRLPALLGGPMDYTPGTLIFFMKKTRNSVARNGMTWIKETAV